MNCGVGSWHPQIAAMDKTLGTGERELRKPTKVNDIHDLYIIYIVFRVCENVFAFISLCNTLRKFSAL